MATRSYHPSNWYYLNNDNYPWITNNYDLRFWQTEQGVKEDRIRQHNASITLFKTACNQCIIIERITHSFKTTKKHRSIESRSLDHRLKMAAIVDAIYGDMTQYSDQPGLYKEIWIHVWRIYHAARLDFVSDYELEMFLTEAFKLGVTLHNGRRISAASIKLAMKRWVDKGWVAKESNAQRNRERLGVIGKLAAVIAF